MSPDGFDDLDRALSRGLSSLAPDVDGADGALAAMRPRFERARTRARVAKIGTAFVALLAVGGVATLAAPSAARSRVNVNGPGPSTPVPVSHPARSTTTSTSTTVPLAKRAPTPTTVPSPRGAGSNPARPSSPAPTSPVPASPVTTPVSVPHNDGGGNGSSPGGGGGGGDHGHGGPSTPPTTEPSSAHDAQVYQSPGGGVTVRFLHGSLSLLGVAPVSGDAADVRERGPSRIDVRFTRHGRVTGRVELQVESGRVVRTDHGDG